MAGSTTHPSQRSKQASKHTPAAPSEARSRSANANEGGIRETLASVPELASHGEGTAGKLGELGSKKARALVLWAAFTAHGTGGLQRDVVVGCSRLACTASGVTKGKKKVLRTRPGCGSRNAERQPVALLPAGITSLAFVRWPCRRLRRGYAR
ncbi:uncharacterized protein K452DRAFT_70773 [Aplosporella prunicola CBS 121167]|uniref:Uncharacterized protein n=1 Tax=Aplosporella prunicola CBS 121167 TaxID=1176127 RepID=A0A6A6BU98_9PEZI|nr:uncharacterized protein K452DRAFT_70773 [Aplosporella prunicola CBS 121167]KAF2146794.1 hypothetical protein K452DRAFT_70773 [Aplosporella prunicola CBS 121167]